jgi:hypothetical protein
MMTPTQPRGITLLISVILASVVLTVALALLDITYKQVLLASTAKQSQYAFYTADSAMECALYWDQQKDAFEYTGSPYQISGMDCPDPSGTSRAITAASPALLTSTTGGGTRTTTFFIPCPAGGATGVTGSITVTKDSTGQTKIYTTGYSSCIITDPRRIERGLNVSY